jgi:hypothetical protein
VADRHAGLVSLLLCPILIVGCVSARISVVDERTALENQILGSYQELDRELLLVASVRSEPTDGAAVPDFTALRQEAIRARQTQQFNRDDREELLGVGCLGEGNDGLLSGHPCDQAAEPAVAARIARLVESDNAARRTLWRFVVTASPDLTPKDLPEVVSAFVRLQQEQAKPGTWIQETSGEWKKK